MRFTSQIPGEHRCVNRSDLERFRDLNRVFAQWSASSDNQSEPGEIRYLLFVNDDPNPTEVVMGITRTVAYGNATGDNTFVLKAIDAAGNVSVSNPVTLQLWC